MAVTGVIERTIDINHGVIQEDLHRLFAVADAQAHTFKITVNANGVAQSLSGHTVIGYFMRNAGGTVVINGSVSGNVATLVLPQSCYSIIGGFQLIIRLVSGNTKTAIYWASGYITRSTTDPVVDPGNVVPDLNDLLAKIDQMEQATEAANTAATNANTAAEQAVRFDTAQTKTDAQKLQARNNAGAAGTGSLAPAFSDIGVYAAGDIVTQGGKLYKFTSAHAAGSWTGNDATEVSVSEEISSLKEDLENIEPLSDEVKEALLACFQNVVWKDGNSQSYYSALERALNGDIPILILFKNGLGFSGGNTSPYIVSIIDNTQRGIVYSESGDRPLINDSSTEISVYPIKIPEGATGVRFHGMQETDYVSINLWILSYIDNNWKFRNGAGFGKIIPDIVQRPEIANYNDGSYYMIGTYGIADATHTNPLYNKDCDIDVTGFEMEIIEKNTILFAKGYGFTVPDPVTVISNSERVIGYTNTGEYEVTRASGDLATKVYPIPIPAGAKGIKFYGMEETDYITVNVQIVKYEDGVWKQKTAAGFGKIVPDTLSRTEIATYAGRSDYFMMYVFGIADATHVNPVQGKTFNNYDITNFRAEVVV